MYVIYSCDADFEKWDRVRQADGEIERKLDDLDMMVEAREVCTNAVISGFEELLADIKQANILHGAVLLDTD